MKHIIFTTTKANPELHTRIDGILYTAKDCGFTEETVKDIEPNELY